MANTTWRASSSARPSAPHLLTGKAIRAGDVLLALPSTGLHTNGYSLARKLLFEVAGYGPNTLLPEVGATVGDALLAVHRSYLKPLRALTTPSLLRGAAHITGGGITDNTPRMLPEGPGGRHRHRHPGPFRRCSRCCAVSATFPRTTTAAPSIWASA